MIWSRTFKAYNNGFTRKHLVRLKSKMTKDENGKNIPHLEITDVVLVHCNISRIIIYMIQEFCIYSFLVSCLVNY